MPASLGCHRFAINLDFFLPSGERDRVYFFFVNLYNVGENYKT